MFWYILSSIGQWAACVLLAGGIIIEVLYRSSIGFLAITIGSGLFAVVTKIKAEAKNAVIKKLLRGADQQGPGDQGQGKRPL